MPLSIRPSHKWSMEWCCRDWPRIGSVLIVVALAHDPIVLCDPFEELENFSLVGKPCFEFFNQLSWRRSVASKVYVGWTAPIKREASCTLILLEFRSLCRALHRACERNEKILLEACARSTTNMTVPKATWFSFDLKDPYSIFLFS